MIAGIGHDLTRCDRLGHAIQRFGSHFLERFMSAREIHLYKAANESIEFAAGRWAAKEAFAKALGTGIGKQCHFQEIEVLRESDGRPYIVLSGTTKQATRERNISSIHVSITHDSGLASAVVILETLEETSL